MMVEAEGGGGGVLVNYGALASLANVLRGSAGALTGLDSANLVGQSGNPTVDEALNGVGLLLATECGLLGEVVGIFAGQVSDAVGQYQQADGGAASVYEPGSP
jgi:hypothetical protein